MSDDQEEPVTPDFEPCDFDDKSAPATFLSPLRSTSRAIVRTDFIYERDGHPSRFWGQPYAYPVASNAAAFEHEMEVGESWVEVPIINSLPSLLYLRNLPTRFQVNPTPEQQAEADAKVIQLDFQAILRPGRDMQFEPTDKVSVRCLKGMTQLLIVAVPR